MRMHRIVVFLLATSGTLLPPKAIAAQSLLSNAEESRSGAPQHSIDDFVRQVADFHPVARQARLLVDRAQGDLRTARGAFDPLLSTSWRATSSTPASSADELRANLTVPTLLGFDVKVGYERLPYSSSVPLPAGRAGQLTTAISIPLGQRLLTDERRTALSVARSIRDASYAERDALVNRILLQAVRDYGRWYDAVQRRDIALTGVTLAEFRLNAVRRRVEQGEAAALDTIEAALEVHRRRVQLVEADQAAFRTRIEAEVYLWDATGEPLALDSLARPVTALPWSDTIDVAALTERALRAHPEVIQTGARRAQAAARQRLATQQQLPVLATELSTVRNVGAAAPSTNESDPMWGFELRTPIAYLRERGRAASATASLEIQELDVQRVQRDIATLVRAAAREAAAIDSAIGVQRLAVQNAERLLRGEVTRFEAGESTLFIVNVRERAVLDERQRLASLEARAFTTRAELYTAAGAWNPVLSAR